MSGHTTERHAAARASSHFRARAAAHLQTLRPRCATCLPGPSLRLPRPLVALTSPHIIHTLCDLPTSITFPPPHTHIIHTLRDMPPSSFLRAARTSSEVMRLAIWGKGGRAQLGEGGGEKVYPEWSRTP